MSALKSGVIRYRSYWTHRVWLGDPKLLQDIFQAERDGLVEKPDFPPFHRVSVSGGAGGVPVCILSRCHPYSVYKVWQCASWCRK